MRRGTSRRERDGECLGGKRGTSKVKRREMDCGGCLGEARERWPLRRVQRESRLVSQIQAHSGECFSLRESVNEAKRGGSI